MAIFPSKYALFLRRAFEKPSPAKISGRATVAPVKNDDFGGVFHPLAGKRFCVTENISRNGKHSLLSPEHTMFRDSKNGSNITSRSRLFAGQSEEASHPFPKPTSGIKSTKKGRSGGVLFKKADWLIDVSTDWNTDWLKSRSYCFVVSLLCWHTVLLFYWRTVLLAFCFVVLQTYWFADISWIQRAGAATRLRLLSSFLPCEGLAAEPMVEAQ